MGILKSNHDNNILTENGFEYRKKNCIGTLSNCYERQITLPDDCYAWISVNTTTSKVVIYVEYECGGEVATYNLTLQSKFSEDEEAFFDELDKEVTSYTDFEED